MSANLKADGRAPTNGDGGQAGGDLASYRRFRAERERVRLERERLELGAAERGVGIPADEVERILGEMVGLFVEAIGWLPARLTPSVTAAVMEAAAGRDATWNLAHARERLDADCCWAVRRTREMAATFLEQHAPAGVGRKKASGE